MKGVTSSYTRAFGESCRREFEKVSSASSGIIPSQSYTCAKYSVVWRLATFILYVSLAHQATDWFVQGKGVAVQILVPAQDSYILNDGSQPELGSVLS